MKPYGIDYRTSLWRGRGGRLWRLADRFVDTAEAIRDAKKPSDLVFPATRMIDLVKEARDMQWEWVAEKMGLDKRNMGRWPKL